MKPSKTIILLFSIILSGCSTTSGKNITCDFVVGTYENESERRERNQNKGESLKSDNVDVANGILDVIFGAVGRSTTDSKKDKCT